jgi:hypothetical protein
MPFLVLTRPLVARVIALAFGASLVAAHAEATRGEIEITCANLSSGASWQIKIDYDRNTVDSNPARISETEISWRDAKDGWYYRLDRKSGNLTVTLASATGGNFLYDRCKLEH